MKQFFQDNRFVIISVGVVSLTIILALYVSSLLFSGENSYEVLQNLRQKQVNLQNKIKQIQQQNAALQKQYLELKNLEPEGL